MKRVAWLFLISTLFYFSLPPSNDAAFGVDLNFAPGSLVRFEHLTIEDGLSQNAGLAIFQDSLGYLWIGTQDGLNGYDGYEFKVFKHDTDDPTMLSHNSILSMGEDKNGSLWIGTWGGGLNLIITLAVFVGWKLPYIANDRQALLAIAILASLKVVNAVTHYLLTRG